MNYLHKQLEFSTVEEGEKKLEEAQAIRDQMGGNLFRGILEADCCEISRKLEQLRRDTTVEDIKFEEVRDEPINEVEQAPEALQLKVDDLDEVYLFKVADYTTILLGRYDKGRDCFYVQRGDGVKYEYEEYRVVWKQKINCQLYE